MSKSPKPRRSSKSTVPAVPAETTPATIPAESGIVASTVATIVAPVIAFVAGMFRFADADGNAFDVPVTPLIARMASAVAAIRTVTATGADRFGAIVDAVRSAWNANRPDGTPETDFRSIPLNRSPWSGNVTETQNAIYVALMVARVPVTSADIVAAWRAFLPVTKCEFESHTRYGASTWSDFAGGRHGSIPGVPTGSWSTAVARWNGTDGFRKPDAWSVTRTGELPTA